MRPAVPERVAGTTELIGTTVGWISAPFFALVSALRRARTFHPHGHLFRGHATPDPAVEADDAELAQRLAADVLVRLSDALSKRGARRFDVLGCAMRFGGGQDLLFATIKRPWTMPFAPLTTHTGDFLANDYFAVTRFETPFHRRVFFRVRPLAAARSEHPTDPEARRHELDATVARGDAVLRICIADGPRGPWRPLVRIVLEERVPDPPQLAFDPFHAGLGIVPRGFVHALRRGAYDASQWARRALATPRVSRQLRDPRRA